jgi:protein-tyrosine phosphatase
MAEGILRKLLNEKGREDIEVQSAGTGGFHGLPASEFAQEVAGEHGVDLSDHRSQPLTEDLLKWADLVLVMDSSHEQFIRTHFPAFRENVFLLKKFDRKKKNPESTDIEDPIGFGKDMYEAVFDELNREIRRILPRILQLAGEKRRESGRDG